MYGSCGLHVQRSKMNDLSNLLEGHPMNISITLFQIQQAVEEKSFDKIADLELLITLAATMSSRAY